MSQKIDVNAIFAAEEAALRGPSGNIAKILANVPADAATALRALLSDGDKSTRAVANTMMKVAAAFEVKVPGKVSPDAVRAWRAKNDVS